MSELRLTPIEFKEVIATYERETAAFQLERSGFPKLPPKAEAFTDWRPVRPNDVYLNIYGEVTTYGSADGPGMKRLILRMKDPEYRFICDNVTPRKPKPGDWIVVGPHAYNNTRFNQVNEHDEYHFEHLIFRREEIK